MRELSRRLESYVTILRLPGVALPSLGTALASIPIGILGLALLLLVRQSSGNFAMAGAVVAVFGVGTGLGIVGQGHLIDRFGPRPVLLVASCAQVSVLFAIAAVAAAEGLPWLLGGLAFLAGLGEPQVGGALRAMWPSLVSPQQRPLASALSSMLFELPVVTGPLVLSALMRFSTIYVAILTAAGLSLVGSLAVALSHAARTWQPASGGRRGLFRPLTIAGVRLSAAVTAVQGLAVGLLQVSCAAFAAERGSPAGVGLLYALLSSGSLIGATLYGAWSQAARHDRHMPSLLLALAVVLAGAATSSAMAILAVWAFAAGLLVGPVSVRCFTDAESSTEPGSLAATATTLTATGLAATSAGTALAGWLIELTNTAYALAAAAGVVLIAGLFVLQGIRGTPDERSPGYPVR